MARKWKDTTWGHRERPDHKQTSWEGQAKDTVKITAGAFHRNARRTGMGLRTQLHNATHGEMVSPGKRIKAILLLALLGLGGLVLVDQVLKQPITVGAINWDPGTNFQPLWVWNPAGSGNLIDFNTQLATYVANCFGTDDCVELNSNSTHTAMVLTKAPVELDTISGHQLLWQLVTRISNYQQGVQHWGMYLTRNGTLPIEALDYNPENDVNVAATLRVEMGAGSDVAQVAWSFQRDQIRTITDDNPGCFCEQQGSLFLHVSDTLQTASRNDLTTAMNFTGNTAQTQALSRLTFRDFVSDTDDSTKTLPWFSFQGQRFFVGIYERASTLTTTVRAVSAGIAAPLSGMHLMRSDPDPSVATPVPPTIDTGGFFGPIIKALIGIGVWILEGISEFLGFIADVFVTAMDAVGGFFRIGAIGTAIRDALTGTVNFIANVFGVAVGWAVTLASLFQNGVAFVTNFFSGSNGFVAWIISFLSTLPGIWAVIQDLWTALNTVVLGMNAIIMIYYIIGMIQVYKSGWDGFKDWLGMGTTLTISVVKAGYWIGKEMFQVILDVKRLLAQWI